MRIKVLTETPYVVSVIEKNEFSYFNGRPMKEVVLEIQNMVEKIVNVKNLQKGSMAFETDCFIVQWFGGVESERFAIETMQDLLPVILRNYKNWVDVPLEKLV